MSVQAGETEICRPEFVESIHCSCLSTDNYEVENLISDNYANRNSGFVAFSFVKPPVTLTWNFKSTVRIINTVRIGLNVGEQICTGLQIFTETKLEPRNYRRYNYQSEKFKWNKLADFEANEYFYPTVIVFSKLQLNEEFCPVAEEFLTRVRKVQIRITRVKTSGPPCLSSVNFLCPTEIFADSKSRDLITQSKSGIVTEHEKTKNGSLGDVSKSEDLLNADDNQLISGQPVDNLKFPDEFTDKITQEIMSKPYLLPSGINIDENTLHKIIESAQSQGRLPFDPFSYQEFSSVNYPVENIELRDRIRYFNRQYRLQKSTLLQNFGK
ncbi:RING finger protein 37-like [Symsagittifera roscoffensis]|uniref:RING finger protein 37-like n=1 Tax=Symsagittifera roscoffensis TaxID=84072 RepID=UPI00307BC5BF